MTRGTVYRERTIDRNFTITLGNGNANMSIGGQNFIADLESGELQQ